MNLDDAVCYRALSARDARFDGVFFVGVKSTGIYCRPVCTAKTPGRARCRFFASAALAERAGFRPCLRCRPELAPGHAPIDSAGTIAHAAAARIEAGMNMDGGGLEELAASLGVSSRQLRRVMRKQLGVSPIELAQTNRLLLAKRLIAETQLPLAQVAFAAGFASVRRFNALFRSHYRLTPSSLRRASSSNVAEDCIRLSLAVRPPLAWDALLQFLEARATLGVECVSGGAYHRTVSLGGQVGWLTVRPAPTGNRLIAELSTALTTVLPAVLVRLRNLFDLDARPDVIGAHLATDPQLSGAVQRQPGLRVPGAFDVFELSCRAILGQQISVKAASTFAGRLAQRCGQPIATPLSCLNRIAPTAETVYRTRRETLVGLGLTGARADTLRALAGAVVSSQIDLSPGVDARATADELTQLPGIGPWTAEYIAMRGFRWPDAFPAGDLGLLKAANLKSSKELDKLAEAWRPWRAYAAMHLWQSLVQ